MEQDSSVCGNGSSSSPARAQGTHFESLVEFLEGKLILVWGSAFDCGPQEFSHSHADPHIDSGNLSKLLVK